MKEILFSMFLPVATRGAIQVASGLGMGGDSVELQAASAVTFAATLAWSVFEKIKQRRALKRAKGE